MISNNAYRWVIVAAGGLLGCVAMGAMFSLPVFLLSVSRDTGWSTTGVSTAMTIAFLAMAVAAPLWGNLSDRIGPRLVLLSGSIILAFSLAIASQVQALLLFQLVFGILVGGACAAIMAPLMATVTGWFDSHRSLAVSLVSAGMGMAPMTMAPLAAFLIEHHDWRVSMLIIAGIVAAIMIPVSLLVGRPPALMQATNSPAQDATENNMTLSEALRSPQFIILAATSRTLNDPEAGPMMIALQAGIFSRMSERLAGTVHDTELFQAMTAFPFADVHVPTLVLHGTDDDVVPLSHARAVAKGVPGAKLVTLSGGGHMALFSHLDEVRSATKDFLSGLRLKA